TCGRLCTAHAFLGHHGPRCGLVLCAPGAGDLVRLYCPYLYHRTVKQPAVVLAGRCMGEYGWPYPGPVGRLVDDPAQSSLSLDSALSMHYRPSSRERWSRKVTCKFVVR